MRIGVCAWEADEGLGARMGVGERLAPAPCPHGTLSGPWHGYPGTGRPPPGLATEPVASSGPCWG